MLRNVSVNTELVEEAMTLGNHKTGQEAATYALKHYIACLERQQSADAAYTSEVDPEHDGT